MMIAARTATPIVPVTARSPREAPRPSSQASRRRGYWTARSPIRSPAKMVTITNEITTTPAAAYR